MQPLLVVDGLKKTYPNFKLNEVSFAVYEDCITGFIGANGAGKTTTIRSILSLISCEAGSIKFKGKDTKKTEKTFKDSIGVVFDEGFFYDELTLAQMKNLIASSYSQWDNGAYTHYLNTFSLKPEQTISSLSRGMKMKFSLALALSHHAELLIMDEPTSGLDPLVRKQFIEILKEYMAQGGKAVFYSTHNTSDLDKAADILVMIDNGKILFEEDKDMLLESHRLVKGKGILPAKTKKLFLKVEQAKYGFTGVTNQVEQTRSMFPDAVFERVTVEDIMLAHIKEGEPI